MPRTVVLRSVLGALACAIALLAAPAAPALAESLTLTVGTDPVAGLPSAVDYEYDTAGQDLNITITARPASGPPCGATQPIDETLVGPSGGAAPVVSTPVAVHGVGGGHVPFTFPAAGSWRVCAWLSRTPDDVAAAAVAPADVRLPRADLALTATEVSPKAGGADLAVHATGSVEAPADLYVIVVSGGTTCPPTYDEPSEPTTLAVTPSGTVTRVSGTFALDFATTALLSFRSWRVCGYLQDGSAAATASTTAQTLADLVLKPALLRRPRVSRKGSALVCDGGRWKARPTQKLKYTWLAGGRPVAGATGKRLVPGARLRGKAVACRVTASNRLGKTTATSRAVRA